MMTRSLAVLAILLGAGCSLPPNRTTMEERLQNEQPLLFDDEDVFRIEQRTPQIQFPIRLAVAPPDFCGHGETAGARDEVLAWGEKLKKAGVVSEFFILPEMLIRGCREGGSQSYVKAVRLAAARLQADAVLLLRSVTDTQGSPNLLAVLDLTIVGMFVIPGHHAESLSVVEGVVIDNRNQFLYFAASAEGSGSTFGPLAVMERRNAEAESRRNALRAFGDLLVQDACRARGFVPGPRYDTPGQR